MAGCTCGAAIYEAELGHDLHPREGVLHNPWAAAMAAALALTYHPSDERGGQQAPYNERDESGVRGDAPHLLGAVVVCRCRGHVELRAVERHDPRNASVADNSGRRGHLARKVCLHR